MEGRRSFGARDLTSKHLTGVSLSSSGPGWRAEIRPADHPVANFDFDVVIGADGRRNTLDGELALALASGRVWG